MDQSDLLNQLRIDPTQRASRRRGRWLVITAVVLLAVGGGLWVGLARSHRPTVRTAVARTITSQTPGAGSVLDASGYVTARRQATVSAKITGKVTEVLIEEGMRVEEGDILARLDDTEAKAQLALARAQLRSEEHTSELQSRLHLVCRLLL